MTDDYMAVIIHNYRSEDSTVRKLFMMNNSGKQEEKWVVLLSIQRMCKALRMTMRQKTVSSRFSREVQQRGL